MTQSSPSGSQPTWFAEMTGGRGALFLDFRGPCAQAIQTPFWRSHLFKVNTGEGRADESENQYFQ